MLIDLLKQLFPGFSYFNSTGFTDGCKLTGIALSNGRHLGNLGSILLAAVAIVVSAYLIWRSEQKQAAVGRRYNCECLVRCTLLTAPKERCRYSSLVS
jgi:Chitin synthase export chaperone